MNNTKILSILLAFTILFSVAIMGFIHYLPSEDRVFLANIKSEVNNLLYKYKDFEDELPVVFNENTNPLTNLNSYISKTEAIEDVKYLFSLLKFGYVGYEYFGGDDAFISAKRNILWSIGAINDDNINSGRLLDFIYRELNFIQDAHFSIGHYILCEYTKYYGSRKYKIYEDKYGFYTFIDDEPYYLTEVNGKEP